MVVKHLLKFGLDKAGYLKRLEKNFSSVSNNERQGVAAERKRVQDALKSIEQKIAAMWRVQMEGALNSEALKMVSEEMNQLAGEKRDLVVYSESLEERAGAVEDVEGRMDFLGDRFDELVRGWKKASAVKQKLLLKRALLGVVVSATETKIIYLNSGQQESDLVAGGTEESSFETEVLGKIVNGIGSDTKKPSRDEKVLSAFRGSKSLTGAVRTFVILGLPQLSLNKRSSRCPRTSTNLSLDCLDINCFPTKATSPFI